MAIRERAPRREQKPSPETFIASHVASVVDNLQQDRQTIQNPNELCRRADMAMVATLQIVAPLLPKEIREQVNHLITMQEEAYKAAQPSTPQAMQDHEM